MPSQSDIARDTQKGLEEANRKEAERTQRNEDDRATQFDGDPNAQGIEGGLFKPQDDTPLIIRKREQDDPKP
ncbi:hypothetical protein [Yanghanlia caeni]|uniref:Uncharacterized protein n=1 Tax=Yanghanlia caeni TaxID=3064283 RepID=A0ABU1D498_9BURK|nr:hypothetical protein [Alcaligenaceae bacterium LG-2]NGR09332.1 hypothetical protein [bacterium SGD-2]HZH57158.1 hypothetical protein [Burkholderiaceae bacterium]